MKSIVKPVSSACLSASNLRPSVLALDGEGRIAGIAHLMFPGVSIANRGISDDRTDFSDA